LISKKGGEEATQASKPGMEEEELIFRKNYEFRTQASRPGFMANAGKVFPHFRISN